jgi:parvulin-like peptidyl-prolyl isomerase
LATEWGRRSKLAGTTPSKVLDELIDQEAAYQQAARSGFLDQPETRQAVREYVAQRYREAQASSAATNAPTTEALRAYYDLNSTSFRRPPAINPAIIRLDIHRKATPEKRAEVLAAARALREQAVAEVGQPANFGRLALDRSVDQATRYRGGEIGWLTHEQARLRLPGPVAEAAFRLAKPGDISEPVLVEDAIYLVKLVNLRAEQARSFEEVRPLIEHEMASRRAAEREAQRRKQLREGLAIRVDQHRLAQITTNRPPVKSESPAPLPKG